MKKILIAGFVTGAALFAGCENYKDELAQMTVTRDSLLAVSNSKDKAIDEFVTSFDEIETNLADVTSKQHSIQVKTGNTTEMTVETKERIKAEIEAIKQLMEDSKAQVAELSKKLKQSNFRIGKFEKMVASLNEQIALKDSQMVVLNDQLLALNTQVTNLNSEVAKLNVKDSVNNSIIQSQTTKINTAFVAMGDYKKLRDQHVVTKEGGFLGLGKAEKLSPQLNTEAFRPVDITQLTTIPVNTKDAKLVTVHPNGSYEIARQNEKVSEIKITDSEKFWSTSKYLVVMTEE
jgi:predicted  nucleic acid-binding Zn-ribbon protein